jgi:hypothetical protein
VEEENLLGVEVEVKVVLQVEKGVLLEEVPLAERDDRQAEEGVLLEAEVRVVPQAGKDHHLGERVKDGLLVGKGLCLGERVKVGPQAGKGLHLGEKVRVDLLAEKGPHLGEEARVVHQVEKGPRLEVEARVAHQTEKDPRLEVEAKAAHPVGKGHHLGEEVKIVPLVEKDHPLENVVHHKVAARAVPQVERDHPLEKEALLKEANKNEAPLVVGVNLRVLRDLREDPPEATAKIDQVNLEENPLIKDQIVERGGPPRIDLVLVIDPIARKKKEKRVQVIKSRVQQIRHTKQWMVQLVLRKL